VNCNVNSLFTQVCLFRLLLLQCYSQQTEIN
jgi:hypothetical protein